MKSSWTRRRFVGAAATVPVAAAVTGMLWSCSDETGTGPAPVTLSQHDQATLNRFCYLLFPYPDIGPAPYEAVVASIAEIVNARPDTGMLVRSGLDSLDQAGQGAFLELDEVGQLAVLDSIESAPFFQFMLTTTKAQLFNDRSVWTYIGYDPDYPLNDIDWLGDD